MQRATEGQHPQIDWRGLNRRILPCVLDAPSREIVMPVLELDVNLLVTPAQARFVLVGKAQLVLVLLVRLASLHRHLVLALILLLLLVRMLLVLAVVGGIMSLSVVFAVLVLYVGGHTNDVCVLVQDRSKVVISVYVIHLLTGVSVLLLVVLREENNHRIVGENNHPPLDMIVCVRRLLIGGDAMLLLFVCPLVVGPKVSLLVVVALVSLVPPVAIQQ
jgi:hypothetical protein